MDFCWHFIATLGQFANKFVAYEQHSSFYYIEQQQSVSNTLYEMR